MVTDLGNGTYDVTVVPTRAGTCMMVLESGSQSRELALLVDAGEAVVSATTFDRSGLDGWRAGEPGVLALKMKDRFGNDVTASSALFTFEGRASGPGGVTVEQSASSDGGALFEFKTTVAGIYKISATCVDTGETAPGLPIDVVMKAGKISHVGCTASLQTITGATKGPGAAAAAFGVAVAMAGEEITCLVDARDRFGNATVWSGESAAVVAHGPAHNPADRAFDVVDVRGGRAGLRGVLPRAGSYTVAVSVDDIPCACSPSCCTCTPVLARRRAPAFAATRYPGCFAAPHRWCWCRRKISLGIIATGAETRWIWCCRVRRGRGRARLTWWTTATVRTGARSSLPPRDDG